MNLTKKNLRLIFQYGITILSIGIIVYIIHRDYEQFKSLVKFDFSLLLIIFFLQFFTLLVQSYRFKLIFKNIHSVLIPVLSWFELLVMSRILNIFVPQAGNVYRGVKLKKDYQLSYTNYFSGYLSYTWLEMLTTFLFAFIYISISNAGLTFLGIRVNLFLIIMWIVILIFPVTFYKLSQKVNFEKLHLKFVEKKVSEIIAPMEQIISAKMEIVKFVILNIIIVLSSALSMKLCFLNFDIVLSFSELLFFVIILRVSMYVSITPGNLGITELAFSFLCETIGVGLTEGLLVSSTIRIVGMITLFLAFIFMTLFKNIKLIKKK